jgi:reversion-inducing cysteine-rich kazal motif protein
MTDPCRDTTVQRFDRLKCSLSSFTSHKLIIKGGVAAEGGATNGSCLDSRGSNKCPTGSSCIGSLGPCLVGVNGTCQQTSCVGDSMCSQFGGRDVCTTSNVTLTDVCSLVRNQSQFAYWGSCKSECSLPNPICGADGNTYHTPCHAHSLHIPIDYSGRCHDDGCGSVRCPPLQNDKCKPVTPPGACCPKCGGLLAVLFDKPQLLQDLPQMGMHTVRVGEVLSRLEEKINTVSPSKQLLVPLSSC